MASALAVDPLSAVFAALADPTRRALLERLTRGEASVQELAKPFHMSLPAVSKHLKVLEHSGLISRARVAQSRPCRLETKPLQEAAGWMEHHRKVWEARLDRLDDYLKTLSEKTDPKEKKHGPPK
jgi:DNA-binding transcriptional ArsR family regulator